MSAGSTVRRAAQGGCAALLAAVAAIGVTPAAAWAHSTLQKSDPAAGSTVTLPVVTITMTFSEMVKGNKTVVTVTGADGADHSEGPAQVIDKNVLQAIRPLPPGAVTVAWKSVALDGDPISGTFAFTSAFVAPSSAAPSSAAPPSAAPSRAAPPSAAPSGAATSSAAPSPGTEAAPASGPTQIATPTSDDGQSSTALWWVAGAVVVLLAAGGGWFWSRSRSKG